MNRRSYFVLGGCGAMGRIAVRDLAVFDRTAQITIGDIDGARARADARAYRNARVQGLEADASDVSALATMLAGHHVVVNCTQHHFNLHVMRAALKARCHYVDLGGLYTWTRRQLKLDGAFRKAGLIAVLGMGGSPGITNVLVRWAAEPCSRICAIHVRSCWFDPDAKHGDFYFPFSPQTIIEELTLPAFAWRDGRVERISPRSRWERCEFPKPFGTVWCLATRHSEVATLPDSFREKGVRRVDFMLGYDREFVREFERRWRAGWRLPQFKSLVAPRKRPRDLELLRVELEGDGVVVTADCVAKAKPTWHASAGDIDTGCPASIVAQMIARGEIAEPGVHPPERIVPVRPFLRALRARGMRLSRSCRRSK
jgi:saccharopine dehydrogenase (NAD+, L-lysine-forming)